MTFAAAVLFGAGSVAAAPAPPVTAEPATDVDAVTVTARSRTQEQLIREFVQTYAKETPIAGNPQVARFRYAICPLTFGLGDAVNAFITDRVRQIAVQIGSPEKEPGKCDVNVTVVITEQPQAFLDRIAKDYEGMLGFHYQRHAASRVKYPIQAWYVTTTEDVKGLARPNSSEPWPDLIPVEGSLINKGFRSWIDSALIVIDFNKIEGMEIGALADYAAMLALAQGEPQADCSPMPTITNLFNGACPADLKTKAMTNSDLAYLKAVYRSSKAAPAWRQKGEIAREMKRILDEGE